MVHAGRRQQTSQPLTEAEKSQARAVLGAIGWKANTSGPQYSAEHGLMTSMVSSGTAQLLLDVNKLLARIKAEA
eukprot:2538442-Lingulodinium_polyedra.AAC.1